MTDQRVRLGFTPNSMMGDYRRLYPDETVYIYEVDEDDSRFTSAFVKYVARYPHDDFYDINHRATDVAKKIPIRWRSIKRWWKVMPGTKNYEVHENKEFQPQPRGFWSRALKVFGYCSRWASQCSARLGHFSRFGRFGGP
ncbi:hypothetical protein ACKVWC_001748 [Pyricularia oryzae]|nr:hypothetical protein MCOR13_011243 [Pyricularia oryzae]QBZ58139.1 hypothetical protein PoMZ_03080 [Pyricularia oryzae]